MIIIQTMRLCQPPDGSTSPKYKLLCFITTKKICKGKTALAFNRDRCCHLVLCLRLIPFHCFRWRVQLHFKLAFNHLNMCLTLFNLIVFWTITHGSLMVYLHVQFQADFVLSKCIFVKTILFLTCKLNAESDLSVNEPLWLVLNYGNNRIRQVGFKEQKILLFKPANWAQILLRYARNEHNILINWSVILFNPA
jgi:hypothetical protein